MAWEEALVVVRPWKESSILACCGLWACIPCNYAEAWFIYRQRVIATLPRFAWAFVVLQNLRLSKSKAIPVTGRGGL
jgi:hypothetical protein